MAHQKDLITYNPAEVLKLKWVTENFRVIGDIMKSPVFYPIPNCGEEWRFALSFREESTKYGKITKLELRLEKQKSGIDKCYVELSYLHLSGRQVHLYSPPVVCIENIKYYQLHLGNIDQYIYQDIKLTVEMQLKVSGYRVSYSASPLPAIDFEPNCQDLLRDLESLYADPDTADITFLVEGQKLFAHSSVIRCRSVVFAKMLDQDMLERKTQRVRIKDASYHVFDCFLMYLYTAKLKDKNWETIYSMYCLAEKYSVLGLKKTCSGWLGANLSVDTVSKCIALACLYEDKELKNTAKQFIRDHLGCVLETSDWKYIVSNQPQLASEVLSFATSYSGVQHRSINMS